VKNGGVPNECHTARKTKDAKGDRCAKYEESEKKRGAREVPHVDISYIRGNNRFVAMFLCQVSPFCIKMSSQVGRLLVFNSKFGCKSFRRTHCKRFDLKLILGLSWKVL